MHDTGCLELVHWDDPEGWNGANLMDVSLSELWELVMDREAWDAAIHGWKMSPLVRRCPVCYWRRAEGNYK